MQYKYITKAGEIKVFDKPVKNPSSKGMKPYGWRTNTMLTAKQAFTK